MQKGEEEKEGIEKEEPKIKTKKENERRKTK